MPLVAPNLDDRRFADLVDEAKTLIPRYTPEWTDHNLSDPGITMIQLFAWLSDIVIYRLNRVPDRLYIKFLQLIGVTLKPPVPARAELTFTLSNANVSTLVIPKGTRIGTVAPTASPSISAPTTLPQEEQQAVVFETDEALIAIGATMKRVQVYDGATYVERTTANDPLTQPYYPFGSLAREGSALLMGFSSTALFPTDEINLYVRVYTDPNDIVPYTCADSTTVPSATVVWEYWAGTSWEKLRVVKDETIAITTSGHVYFTGPKDIAKTTVGAVTDEELYWIRVRLQSSQYEMAPRLEAVLTNTVRATAAVTTGDEVAGSSNGTANQTFLTASTPIYAGAVRPLEERLLEKKRLKANPPTEAEQAVLDDALRLREYVKGFLLEVQEGTTIRPWEEVEDFYNSDPDDLHYTLDRSAGEIRFGNGTQGRIPLAGINNIIARYYRYGGGSNGNAGYGTITDLRAGISGLGAVTNYWVAEGGADEESVEDAKARAPKELKARDRAVTSQDFEFLALEAPGVRVRRAHAMPLYHPDFPGTPVPGVITVIVIPESDDPKPIPSEGTMKTVCAYLSARRLLTTEVHVAPPNYRLVRVEASVVAKATADPAQLKTTIETKLSEYLHPLTGGSDGLGWPMGGAVLYSEIFRVVLQVDGVQIVEKVSISIDGEPIPDCTNAAIPADYLVYSDGHDVTVVFTSTS
ncbi:MAG: putative baseplate assembly protein [Bacteroidetes bacterium]|nr:putative baseplate assembly protein [Bacteroidota bacterium]